MVIAVSACLLGENCKYNGGNNRDEAVLEYVKGHTVVPVCPEVMGGLPVPRVPSEICGDEVINREGVSVDMQFRAGAQKALELVMESGAELVVLQSRSPSCGAEYIYDGSFSGRTVPGKGIFARLLEENGIALLDASKLHK